MSSSQVLDSPDLGGGGSLGPDHQVTFLDEFRIIATMRSNSYPEETPDFFVFDTLIPHGEPGSLRRFKFSLGYHGLNASIHPDDTRPLWTLNRDCPLTIDQTQAIRVMELFTSCGKTQAILILRPQSLIEHMCSVQEDIEMPWDAWAGDTVVVKILPGDYIHPLAIHGSHMLALLPGQDRAHLMHVFDFTLRGKDTLRFSGGGAAGGAAPEDGSWVFMGVDRVSPWGYRALGDSLVTVVSLFQHFAAGACG